MGKQGMPHPAKAGHLLAMLCCDDDGRAGGEAAIDQGLVDGPNAPVHIVEGGQQARAEAAAGICVTCTQEATVNLGCGCCAGGGAFCCTE